MKHGLEWTWNWSGLSVVYGGPDWNSVDWSEPCIRVNSELDRCQEWTVESDLERISGLEWTVDWSLDYSNSSSGPQTIKNRLKWTSQLMWTKDWSGF